MTKVRVRWVKASEFSLIIGANIGDWEGVWNAL